MSTLTLSSTGKWGDRGLRIGYVGYDGKKFYRICGWLGRIKCVVREVKPKYVSETRGGFNFQKYTYRAVTSEMKIMKLDHFWDNLRPLTFKELEAMEDGKEKSS